MTPAKDPSRSIREYTLEELAALPVFNPFLMESAEADETGRAVFSDGQVLTGCPPGKVVNIPKPGDEELPLPYDKAPVFWHERIGKAYFRPALTRNGWRKIAVDSGAEFVETLDDGARVDPVAREEPEVEEPVDRFENASRRDTPEPGEVDFDIGELVEAVAADLEGTAAAAELEAAYLLGEIETALVVLRAVPMLVLRVKESWRGAAWRPRESKDLEDLEDAVGRGVAILREARSSGAGE